MLFQYLAQVSLHGDGVVNEDEAGGFGDAFWVLDGATGVGADGLRAASDAQWYVQRFSEGLRAGLAAIPSAASVDLVRTAIAGVKGAYEKALQGGAPDHPPSAAFMMARIQPGPPSGGAPGADIEFCALGDCTAMFLNAKGEVETLSGDGAGDIDAGSLAALRAAQAAAPGASHEEIVAAVRPILRKNRLRMNVEGGYWILSLGKAAADRLSRTVRTVDPAAPILLMTDGFTRGLDMPEPLDAAAFYHRVVADGPEAVARSIRAAEASDPSCRRFPRFKCRDDATCVMLKLA